ncbi:MAG: MFS transporter [Chloroflexi bacterium]|nr:MFS transporter [Chloroflexota bacterium]
MSNSATVAAKKSPDTGPASKGGRKVRKNVVLAFLSLSTFLIFLDGTVVNTALPAIARDFSANNSVLQWIVNMYSLILAGFLLVAGTTGDRFGRRRALAAGMVIFGAGAVGAALADNSTTLIAMRGVQGLGAAFALPSTLSIITDVFPRGERARAILIWTAIGSMGIAVGPALGGYLVDKLDWSAVFWLNIPVVALSLIGLKFIPESSDPRRLPIDVTGAILATGGLLAIVYGLIQGGEAGWTSGEILGSLLGGVALLVAFAVVEARSSHPMLPLHYFKRMDFTGSFLVLMLFFLGGIAVFFFTTQFYQLVQGRTALVAGLALTPVAPMMIMGTGISSKTVPSIGPKFTIVTAGLIVMIGIAVFSQLEVDTAIWIPIVGMMIFGIGFGMAMPTVTDTIMASVPVNDAGVGSAMNDLSRELGFVLGIAILGSLATSLYRTNVTDAIAGLVPDGVSEAIGNSIGAVGSIAAELPADVALVVTESANASFVDALNIAFLAAAGFVGLGIVVALALVPRRSRSVQAELGDVSSDSVPAEVESSSGAGAESVPAGAD